MLRCRNATQTSVVLEWDPIQLATADLISLALYRNGQKAGNIPKPLSMHTTKISGLAVDTEYTFHLVLRTTAGTLASQRVAVRTHKMTDLSGITITTGILPAAAREALAAAVERVGAKIVDGVRIDTTHFVTVEGRGVQWEKANELNIPVVRPEWVHACERSGRILGVTKFYLDAARVGPGYDERPGTAGTVATTASVPASASVPAPAPSPPNKDLPPPPPSNGAGSSQQPSGPAPQDADVAARQKEEGGVESESSDSEADGQEQKIKSPDEQKVLADERDQKQLAARPKPTVEDDDDEAQEENAGSEDEKGGKSPGDGSSFQDVAL